MSKYKVSIIVPVWGVEKYIEKCLETLVNQTLKEIEIVVVNDGSPDNSQKIIDKYVKKYPNKVKSYIKENGGQGSARNYGLLKANGEYIGYVDSDDYVEVNMFEKMYKKAKEKDLDIVICGNYNVYENDKRDIEYDIKLLDDNKKNSLFGKVAVWNKIYKKELLINNKLEFRSKVWYEDLDFTFKVFSLAKKIEYIDEPFYNYLIRPGSTMNNSNIDRNLEILLSFDEILKNKKMLDDYSVIEYLAITHIYLFAIVRVINSDASNANKKEVIKKLKDYVTKNFPNFKSNEYLYLLPKRRRLIYEIIKLNQYWLIKILFRIKRGGKL